AVADPRFRGHRDCARRPARGNAAAQECEAGAAETLGNQQRVLSGTPEAGQNPPGPMGAGEPRLDAVPPPAPFSPVGRGSFVLRGLHPLATRSLVTLRLNGATKANLA